MKLSLTAQAGLLAGSRATVQVLNALVGIVVVRFISQDDYGTFRQVYLLFATLVVLTDMGLCESLFYFLPRSPQRKKTLMIRSTWIVGLAQVLVGVAIVGFAPVIGRLLNNPGLPPYLGLLAVYLGLSVVTRLWEVQLVSDQRIPQAALVNGGFEALKVGLMFASLAIRPGIEGLMWALVTSAIVKAVAYAWFLLREYGPKSPPESGALEPQFRYAMALWIPGMLNTLAMQAHQFIVGVSFTPAEFAIYSVACFQVPLTRVLVTSINEVMLVRVTAARSEGREDVVRQVWLNASTKSLAVLLPMAIGLAVLSLPLITVLFTANYAAAAPLFAILMFNLPLSAVFTNNILRAYGAMTDYAKFYTVRLVLGLLLGIAGVLWLGMWGVALSSVVSLYAIVGWQLIRVSELLGLRFRTVMPWRAIGKILLACAVASVPAAACVHWIPMPAVALVAGLLLFATTYGLIALKMGLVGREELRSLAGEARRVFPMRGAASTKPGDAAL